MTAANACHHASTTVHRAFGSDVAGPGCAGDSVPAAITPAAAGESCTARIGPNAVIQLAHAMDAHCGRRATARVFREAGLSHYLENMPQVMIDEREVIGLHGVLRGRYDPHTCAQLARDAGVRTGDYVRENRIPAVARRLLRLLPASLSAPMLSKAIARNAWTFVGSGSLQVRGGHSPGFDVADCPLCRGVSAPMNVCEYYAATFERLFQTLVRRSARVVESSCIAHGDTRCRFDLHLG